MATRFSAPFVREVSDVGVPLSGAKLYFYASGTSTPQNTYSDAALTVANANPVVADSGGRFGDIYMGAGTYKVVLKTASGTTVWTADPVAGAVGGTSSVGASTANLLINGDFARNQRSASTAADGAYGLDRWYVLTSTGSVTLAQQALTENGQPTNLRMTQPDATAKRIGIAQVAEAKRSQYLRGSDVAFAGRVRISVSQPVRYAILEWTGTADSITKDFVNDWTSASYVAGGFFVASNVVVASVGSITPAANTWTDLPDLTATMSGSLNNLAVMVWTEGTLAQNATLDLGLMQANSGTTAADFERVPITTSLAQCGRFYSTIAAGLRTDGYLSAAGQTASISATYPAMRATPTSAATWTTQTNISNGPFLTNANGLIVATGNSTAAGQFQGVLSAVTLDAEL